MKKLINFNKNSVVYNESILSQVDEKIGYSKFIEKFYANESSKSIVECIVVVDDFCELTHLGEQEWGYRVEYFVVVHEDEGMLKRTRVDIDEEDRIYHEEYLVLHIHDIVHLISLDYGKIPRLPEKKVA
jgi:hypothetical protein